MPNKNIIHTDIHTITPELKEALLLGKLPYNLEPKRRKGLYIVLFRVLNNKSTENILVYNYIYYSELFIDSFLLYLASIRTKQFINNRPEGDNFIVIDDYFNLYNIQVFGLNDTTRYLDILTSNTLDIGDPYTMIHAINKINYLASYNVIMDLLWYAYFNQYNKFFKTILSYHPNPNYDVNERWFYSDEDWHRSVSLINGTML